MNDKTKYIILVDGKWVQGVWFPNIFLEPKLGRTNIGERVMIPENVTPEGGTVQIINIDELIDYLEKINEDWDRARGMPILKAIPPLTSLERTKTLRRGFSLEVCSVE